MDTICCPGPLKLPAVMTLLA